MTSRNSESLRRIRPRRRQAPSLQSAAWPSLKAWEIPKKLFAQQAAGDAVSGVARWVGFLVISLGVDDKRRATVAEQRMAAAADRDVLIFHLEVGFAVRVDGEVRVIAGVMAFGILQAVFLSIGIEMWASRFEIGRVTLRVLMKVDGMYARRQVFEVQFHPDSFAGFPKGGGADRLALSILELDFNLSLACRCQRDHEHGNREHTEGFRFLRYHRYHRFHGGIIAKGGFFALPILSKNYGHKLRTARPDKRSTRGHRSTTTSPLLFSGLARNARQWDNR